MSIGPPPKPLRMLDVIEYVRLRTGNEITKMTVYNWTNHGIKGVKLRYIIGRSRTKGFPDLRLTTPLWVDEFLRLADAARRGR